MHYDILGKLYTPSELDEEGNIIKQGEALSGFHINTTDLLEGLDEYLVTPSVPRVIFAGAETYHYRFADEQEARELLPAAFPDTVSD
jgi:hypothetical protein